MEARTLSGGDPANPRVRQVSLVIPPMARLTVQTIVFCTCSMVSLPGGVFVCWLGFRGRFLDASDSENALAGLAFLVIGLVPPALAIASRVCHKRVPEQRAFEVGRRRDGGKAG